ncbi:hypothetical protein [uncultured Dialister sp.]|uniref:hypothetical protein n=1 Tax=uncultured Dialister sp. TaxID=278064 RepID=UPI002675E069|nr:hypothetical protein [uncultured Dialister sp.]
MREVRLYSPNLLPKIHLVISICSISFIFISSLKKEMLKSNFFLLRKKQTSRKENGNISRKNDFKMKLSHQNFKKFPVKISLYNNEKIKEKGNKREMKEPACAEDA